MTRPHESPDCKCPGCAEWDLPWDNYIKQFAMLVYRDGKPEE